MNNITKQILLGSALGDGHFAMSRFETGSANKEWIDFKAGKLRQYLSPAWYTYVESQGYSSTSYHKLRTLNSPDILYIKNLTLAEKLCYLDEVGLAIWLYDDGSLHKNNLFYNLSTHAFTLKEHKQLIIPTLMKFGIEAEVLREVKKNGCVYYYTYISKRKGAEIINKILKKYPIECFKYKTFSGDINNTITNKFVKTIHLKTNKQIIHEGINVASEFIKSYPAKLKQAIKTGLDVKGFTVEYYYYDYYCSTTIPEGSRAKWLET